MALDGWDSGGLFAGTLESAFVPDPVPSGKGRGMEVRETFFVFPGVFGLFDF